VWRRDPASIRGEFRRLDYEHDAAEIKLRPAALFGRRDVGGKHVTQKFPFSPFVPPDDDVLTMVEFLAGLVMQFVLPDFGRRGALGEHFDRFEPNAGDSGIERSLPELLYRGRASNGFTAGGHHLTVCGYNPASAAPSPLAAAAENAALAASIDDRTPPAYAGCGFPLFLSFCRLFVSS
jgi:hypothetical protein